MSPVIEAVIPSIVSILTIVAGWAIVELGRYLREKRKSAAYIRMIDEAEREAMKALKRAGKAVECSLGGTCEDTVNARPDKLSRG